MANPRQRSKARSHKSTKPSLSVKRRMHHKLNKAPPLKGPEVLQGQWDKTKTVFQNYAALGLLPSIPLPQGPSSSRSHRAKLPFLPGQPAAGDDDDDEALKGAIVGYGRIIRDDEGNVIDIILPEDEAGAQGGEEQDAGSETEEPRVVEAKTEVVKSLEALAATAAPVKRHTSVSERTWLHNLVEKHGDDTEAMATDLKLNVWQKTQGEIKRMIKKAGGVDKLRKELGEMDVD
ncbi:ribosomal large subunit biogenesis-related protein [Papiliotrema laurentii]|uniref:Nucleolar protein 16 n=1 Tax=Papiliotrema laurentii TaxID=5418 RepID=A0AAD9L946_PAPLA|nr:ribosomal large subunit biogenesis-related protein [Papiliotrema laurentii]